MCYTIGLNFKYVFKLIIILKKKIGFPEKKKIIKSRISIVNFNDFFQIIEN